MLIGNAPCSWGITYPDGNRTPWRQYLDEVAAESPLELARRNLDYLRGIA